MSASGRVRIALVAPEFPPDVGGMHTLARGLAQALAATDDVSVLTVARDPESSTDGFRVHRVLDGRLHVDAERMRAYEEQVDFWLLLNGGSTPIATFLAKPAFAYLHGNDFLNPWIGYGSWWLEPVRRPYMGSIRRALRRAALRRAMPAIRHVFTNSARTAELAEQRLALAPGRITVCPPGVDDCFFQGHEGCSDGFLHLLTVTRLTRYSARKNVDGVLAALALLKGRLAIRYTIVGDGDDRARLEDLARELGVAEEVEFAGTLAAEELLGRYRKADLFILASKASRDDVEGFGIVYLEACAAGVPVICSREGGAVDAVEPGRNGLVLQSSAAGHIAEGIAEFARTRDRFKAEDIRAFAETYRWPRVAAKLRARALETLTNRGPSPIACGATDAVPSRSAEAPSVTAR
jgi:phosphatidyl-myo-inositol dimannoside synthase